tara:strand:- start:32 stop:547 length:516 start_codon:yes stop_codon:yes gene_type:complete
MSTVRKIGGIGTRKSGADASDFATKGISTANTETFAKFITLIANGTIIKGACVALDISKSTDGQAIYVVQADGDATDDADTVQLRQGFGIACSAASSGDLLKIQIYGICDFAILDAKADTVEGDYLMADNDTGELTVYGASKDQLPVAFLLEEGSDTTADSTVFLVNVLNL